MSLTALKARLAKLERRHAIGNAGLLAVAKVLASMTPDDRALL